MVEISREFAWPSGLVDEVLAKQTVWEIAWQRGIWV